MTRIDLHESSKLTFAEQGSAPATPASGLYLLYAKSDGKLYGKSDGGTESDLTAGSSIASLACDFKARTAGDVTTNNTSWTDFDNGMDLSVAAAAGNKLGIDFVFMCDIAAVGVSFNAKMVTSGNMAVTQTYSPIYAWSNTGVGSNAAGRIYYTVVSGDISGGNVAIRVQYKSTGAVNRTVLASTTFPARWGVVNYG